MANQIEMAKVHSILTLHRRGWSNRRIARELGVHRKTVSRYVRALKSGQAKVTTNPPPGSAPSSGPPSACEPFRELILEKLEQGLSAQRIWQDLRLEDGFANAYDSVKRFVRRLGRATPFPFRRIECPPGEQAQVDFGRGAAIIGSNQRRRGCWVFRIVLSHSQGLRRSGLPPEHRQLPAGDGECLLVLQRSATDDRDR